MSEALRAKWQDPEYRAIHVKSAEQQWSNPEYRQQKIDGARKQWEDPAYREAQTQRLQETWTDPEISGRREKTRSSPEYLAKVSEASLRMWADPTHREKVSVTNYFGRQQRLEGISTHGTEMDGGLSELFQSNLPMVDWVRIESGMTGRGIPDINGAFDGAEFWIEFKQTQGWACSLRPEQCAWLFRRARERCRAYVVTRRRCDAGPRRPAADELWIHHGLYARELKAGGLRSVPPLLHATGGPRLWPWPDVLRILTKGGP